MVAIYGPVEVKYKEKESLERANVEVLCKKCSGMEGPEDREKEFFVRNAFDAMILSSLHPRTTINIVLEIMNEDGSV